MQIMTTRLAMMMCLAHGLDMTWEDFARLRPFFTLGGQA